LTLNSQHGTGYQTTAEKGGNCSMGLSVDAPTQIGSTGRRTLQRGGGGGKQKRSILKTVKNFRKGRGYKAHLDQRVTTYRKKRLKKNGRPAWDAKERGSGGSKKNTTIIRKREMKKISR